MIEPAPTPAPTPTPLPAAADTPTATTSEAAPVASATAPAPAPSPAAGLAFAAGDAVTLIDTKARRTFAFLVPNGRVDVARGCVKAEALIGTLPGARLRTTAGDTVAAYRTTLEEYVLLMPRAATVVPPKDIAHLVHWADVYPGATVVEAGTGSGALTLGLMRAVGHTGKVIGFELRPDHLNRSRKNIEAWPDTRGVPFDLRIGDVHQELYKLENVDRVVLDLPDPQNAVPGAAAALKPGGIVVAYLPGIRQVDAFVLAILDHNGLAEPEVVEVIVRPWVADRQRLRPEQRIIGHTGFLVRARRRGPALEAAPSKVAREDSSTTPEQAGDPVSTDDAAPAGDDSTEP
jgi:tRNA (adenine57-N1/adenine58-N1)-methyltransferase